MSKAQIRRLRIEDGETPLWHAAAYGRIDTVKYLVEQGANIDAKSNDGKSVIDAAADKVRPFLETFSKIQASLSGSKVRGVDVAVAVGVGVLTALGWMKLRLHTSMGHGGGGDDQPPPPQPPHTPQPPQFPAHKPNHMPHDNTGYGSSTGSNLGPNSGPSATPSPEVNHESSASMVVESHSNPHSALEPGQTLPTEDGEQQNCFEPSQVISRVQTRLKQVLEFASKIQNSEAVRVINKALDSLSKGKDGVMYALFLLHSLEGISGYENLHGMFEAVSDLESVSHDETHDDEDSASHVAPVQMWTPGPEGIAGFLEHV